MVSGSINSVLQAGTGPNCRFSINIKVPLSAKLSNSGQVLATVAREPDRISVLKSNSGGGGFIETFKGLRRLVVGCFGFAEKLGIVVFTRVSMDERVRALFFRLGCGLDKKLSAVELQGQDQR